MANKKEIKEKKLFEIIGVDKHGVEYVLQQCYEEFVGEVLNQVKDDLNSNTYVMAYNHKCLVKSDIFGAVITKKSND